MALRAVVPAAGSASRYGRAKLYEPLAGDTVIGHALRPLLADSRITQIIVSIAADDSRWHGSSYASHSKVATVTGGASRALSVLNGLNAAQAADDDWVLVHDGARPCLQQQDLDSLLRLTDSADCGALLAAPVYDTIKHGLDGKAQTTIDRSNLWRALTPQLFRHTQLQQVLAAADEASDEAQAMEQAGVCPVLVHGRSDNIKITCAQDLVIAEAILAQI